MVLSSRRSSGCGLVDGVVAQHCPQDVESSAAQGEDGLGVMFAFGAFAVVVGAGGRVGADGGLGREVAGAQQASVVAAGAFEVAADAPGIAGYRRQPGDAGKAVDGAKTLMSPPVAAMNSAPRVTPNPGMLRMISAWRWRRNRSSIIVSVSAISVSRLITSLARRATMAAASCCPATMLCWALAASMAVAATASALRALRLRNHAASRAAPARRIPSGVW